MAYPKFILTDGGQLRLGMVEMHKDLLRDGESCLGGGFYEFDYASSRLLLSGSSFDYGRPKWNLVESVTVPEAYSGLTIIYSENRHFGEEPPLSDFVRLQYI